MKAYAVSPTTQQPIKNGANLLEPGAAPPEGVEIKFLPRIRCFDCTTKLYTALPGKVEEQFEVHLRNKNHRAAVLERVARERAERGEE